MDNQETSPINTQESSESTSQLERCIVERDEWKDKFIRLSADFENVKRRTEKERVLWMRTAQSGLLFDLLTVVDDFDRAFEQLGTQDSQQDTQVWIAGFSLIRQALHKFLEGHGVKAMEVGGEFDPELQEAVMQTESADHASGSVVAVLQKGYLFKDQVLRPAKVSVAK